MKMPSVVFNPETHWKLGTRHMTKDKNKQNKKHNKEN